MSLPPGVKPDDFARALREFAAAVGPDWVFSSDSDVALYDDSFSPFSAEPELQRHASAAVAPDTVEQVQSIVKIANRYKVPLYAISTGRNLGYGGSAPVYSGSVVVDLKRMNRILEVNEAEGYMVVEPGVSFLDLRRYLDERNLPFMCSTPEPGWGSPIGNALDHGCSNVVGDNFGMDRRSRKAHTAMGDCFSSFSGSSLFSFYVLHRIQGELRRVQSHGACSIWRTQICTNNLRSPSRPEIRWQLSVEHGLF